MIRNRNAVSTWCDRQRDRRSDAMHGRSRRGFIVCLLLLATSPADSRKVLSLSLYAGYCFHHRLFVCLSLCLLAE